MALRLTRLWVNRVEECVLCVQSSFTSAQHITMWELKKDKTVLHFKWDSSLPEERKDAHAHFLAFHNIFGLNCMWYDFVLYAYLCATLCVYFVSQPVKRRWDVLHMLYAVVCDVSVFLLGYFTGWLIWFDIGAFVLCEQSALGRIGFVMRKW